MTHFKNRTRLLDTRPRKLFFAGTAFTSSFTYLTSGVFLTGLALLMGAGDILTSYISIILNICGVLIIFFAPFLARFKSRKRLAIGLTALSRVMTLLIVLVPVIFPSPARLPIFVVFVVIAFTLQAQTTVVVNQWMLPFIDAQKKGRYISFRQTLTLAVNVALSLAGGYFLDYMGGEYWGFVILFSVAAAMGIGEIILLALTPNAAVEESATQRCKFRQLVKLPFKDKKFLGFVVYIFFFYTILYIGDSYTTLFMMKYLELPFKITTILSMIMSLPQLLLLNIWGKIHDKKGSKFVLNISIWLFLGETIFMFFAAPNSYFVFIPIAFLISSAANAGFTVSSFNRRYELMPEQNRIVYDNFYSAAVGLGFIFGPMIAGAIKGGFESNAAIMGSMPLANVRLLFLVATAGIIILQVVYNLIQRKKHHVQTTEIDAAIPAVSSGSEDDASAEALIDVTQLSPIAIPSPQPYKAEENKNHDESDKIEDPDV